VHSRKWAAASALALATALIATGCAADGDNASSTTEEGGITIQHAFGETVVPEGVERVVTLGWGSTDAAIALGVIPVAIPFEGYAGDENGVLPWIREAIEEAGEEIPTVLPDSPDEPPYEEIDAANPEVILAPYSGITEEQYDLLSEIAPVVAYPETPWATPWRDVISITGEALGKSDEATAVLDGIDEELAAQAEAHPEFAGKTIAAVWDTAGTFYVYKKADPRVEFLFDLGFVNAPAVDELSNGDDSFFYTLSYEQLDQLEADVVLSFASTPEEGEAFLTGTATSLIPAVQAGGVATLTGTEYISAVSPPTALSLPWGLDALIEALTSATNPV